MSNGIGTDPGTVGPGQIQFFDSIEPPLGAGEYTLNATQQILDIPGEQVAPYVSTQNILIDGPRFTLSPSLIHTVFPPANQNGLYDNVLPNIVFNNFSLPWSRPIDPPAGVGEMQTATNVVPWMGLLTLYPDDLAGASPKAGMARTMKVTELVNPIDPTVLPPALGDLFGAGDQDVSAVDMDIRFFQSIAPSFEELPFLAHARSVNTDGKILLGMNDDGCFSLLTGNRLPQAAAKNTIYVVSYEGHEDHLRGSTIPANYTKIRLVLLGSWQFTADASQGSFVQLMGDLCEPGRGGVTLLQLSMNPATAGEPVAEEAIKIGYVALQNTMRQGETATSWYRGPLVPAPTKRDFEYGPYHFSDHAIHYDPENGLFSHAYSAAWQMGRLLALSDASFSRGLFAWRNKYLKSIVQQNKKTGEQKLRIISGVKAEDMAPADMRSATQQLFTGSFSQVTWPHVELRFDRVLGSKLPGVLNEDEKAAVLEGGTDPLQAIKNKIKEVSNEVMGKS